ncbi:MAG: ribbon-helix-helix protein, CopG family [Granulosicoccus sp.]
MATSNILTVRMQEDELLKLDELAKLQNRPRSQLVQDAIRELLHASEELKQQEFHRLKARLAPAIEEQCALLEKSSVADEHRRF